MTESSKYGRVPFPNLISEMVFYAKKKHAEIVFKKCMEAGRLKWAMKIALHYGLQIDGRHDDTVISLAMALQNEDSTTHKK